MKSTDKLKALLVLAGTVAFSYQAEAQIRTSAQFQVGITIVDPCTLKGRENQKQCEKIKAQTKKQQASKPKKKKPVRRDNNAVRYNFD